MNLQKKVTVFFAVFLALLPISLAKAQSITVIQIGMGTSVSDATRNATENALIAVAGSFIDSETLLQKRKEIKDGIKTVTKSMDTNISEFSQGFVEKVEVLDTTENNGLFQVEAAVTVEQNSFEPFVKKITVGERKIKKGLLSSLQTNQNQAQEFDELIVEKIVNPILTGEVVDISIGEIQQLTSPQASLAISQRQEALKRRFGKEENLFGIKFKISLNLKKGFLDNYKSVIKKMSKSEITAYTCGPSKANDLHIFWSKDLVWNHFNLSEDGFYWSEFPEEYYKVDSDSTAYKKMAKAQSSNCKTVLYPLFNYVRNSKSFEGFVVEIKNGSKINDYLRKLLNISSYELRFIDENDNIILSETLATKVGHMYDSNSPHFSIGNDSLHIPAIVEGLSLQKNGALLRISENFEINLIGFIPEDILANSDRIEAVVNPKKIELN